MAESSNDENKLPEDIIDLDSSNNSNDSRSCSLETVDDDNRMDELVSSLSHKLRLKSSSCLSLCKQHRFISPYSEASQATKGQRNRSAMGLGEISPFKRQKVKVPCQLMRELLEEGSLISEAVKRLQTRSHRHSSDLERDTLRQGVCDTLRTSGTKLDNQINGDLPQF